MALQHALAAAAGVIVVVVVVAFVVVVVVVVVVAAAVILVVSPQFPACIQSLTARLQGQTHISSPSREPVRRFVIEGAPQKEYTGGKILPIKDS